MDKIRVLFVCTGNICRSPSAEGILRQKAEAAGLAARIEVDSAGTHGYHRGDPPDPRAIRQAARRGYDLSDLRARTLSDDDFTRFDLIVGMDGGHMRILERTAPAGTGAEFRLLMDYAGAAKGAREVPDPYYGGPDDYDMALDLIEAGVDGLLGSLRQRLA